MPPADVDPIEKKSYTKHLFVLGTIFFIMSVWAFLNEFVERRSWKEYQRDFNRIEYGRVEQEYEQLKSQLDADALRQIRLKVEEAQIRLESDEARDIASELAKRQVKLSDLKQRVGFAKADQDEVYYEWKHAQEQGRDFTPYKKEYEALQVEMDSWKEKVVSAEADVAEIQEGLDVYLLELERWRLEEKKYFAPLEAVEIRLQAIRERSLDIRQVVLEDFGKAGIENWGRVDRCESCHVAINREGFEDLPQPFRTHPHRQEIFDRHPIENFGCTSCHWGQGRATEIEGEPLEEGDHVHGIVHHWERPLLRGPMMQSACNQCHQDQWELDFAPVYMKGKKLFWNLGCTGCHNVKGFEEAPKVGPSLRKIAAKVNEPWLVDWIRNPAEYLPHTKMPTAPLDIDEPGQVTAVAAYLVQASKPYGLPFGSYPGGDAARGQQLFETVGCLGCHTLGEKGTGLAAALDRIASKTTPDWIFNWIQDPKAYNPGARMPSLRLTRQEAADVTAFLARQGEPRPPDPNLTAELQDPEAARRGYLLVSQYGCYGCHEIEGYETASKLSVDLSSFGRKDIHELDFGDTEIPRTWEDWLTGKLKDPRRYLTLKTSSRMPNFRLSDEQVEALVVFLKGLRDYTPPPRYIMSAVRPGQKEIDDGRRLTERLNCRGCHLIEGQGRLIAEHMEDPGMAPPSLMGIGARVRPDWMFDFLKDPNQVKIRPWINIRMPTFGFTDERATTVVRFFSGLDGYPAGYTQPPEGKPDPALVEAGRRLASSDFFSCNSCHIVGGQMPPVSPAQRGPDLAKVRDRIRYDFLPEWFKDPQQFTPGVIMPGFLMTEDSGPPDILEGDEGRQAEALREYLMTLGP